MIARLRGKDHRTLEDCGLLSDLSSSESNQVHPLDTIDGLEYTRLKCKPVQVSAREAILSRRTACTKAFSR